MIRSLLIIVAAIGLAACQSEPYAGDLAGLGVSTDGLVSFLPPGCVDDAEVYEVRLYSVTAGNRSLVLRYQLAPGADLSTQVLPVDRTAAESMGLVVGDYDEAAISELLAGAAGTPFLLEVDYLSVEISEPIRGQAILADISLQRGAANTAIATYEDGSAVTCGRNSAQAWPALFPADDTG